MKLRRRHFGQDCGRWLVSLGILGLAACSDSEVAGDRAQSPEDASVSVTALEDGSEFIVTTIAAGRGAAAAAGDLVSVHYSGWLYDPATPDNRGRKFDSSVDRGTPFQFPLGAGRVIAGWDQGVDGMQLGEERELIIPAAMAYGDRGAGNAIPPGATLLFEVELLSID